MWVGKALFRSFPTESRTYEDHHLASMMEIARCSSWPPELLGQGANFSKFFETNGLPTKNRANIVGDLIRIKQIESRR